MRDIFGFQGTSTLLSFTRHNECQVKKIVEFTSKHESTLLTIIATQGIIDLIIVSNVIREVRTHD